MKNCIILFSVCILHYCAVAQEKYWQQEVDYTIDVSLNDVEHVLDGFLKLQYTNNSPDTLSFIWFHLWPNAYKNDQTAFSEQLLQNGRTDFYFSDKEDRGYINRLDFRQNQSTLKIEDHPRYIDVIKVNLLSPLAPGHQVEITTPFHVKLPKNFSRGGHTAHSYQLTQWYPKPAVYDRTGWHPMPYLDQGEFYSEFGNYDVRITIPENYVVAATGVLQNGKTMQETGSNQQSAMSSQPSAVSPPMIKKKSLGRKKPVIAAKSNLQIPLRVYETKILRYKQDNVHDFAWFADKTFEVNHDTLLLPSGRTIDVYAFYTPGGKSTWKNSVQLIKDAVLFRSMVLGEYPYNVITAVDAEMGVPGGMEYPTITAISISGNEKMLEGIIEHEVGHNWFYGMIANNERNFPWMDEGINNYYDQRYHDWKYGNADHPAIKENWLRKKLPLKPEEVLIDALAKEKKDQPISTSSEDFSSLNYELIAYAKTAIWMKELEKNIGRVLFDSCMKEYARRWQFKHPYPEDFRMIMEKISGRELAPHFSLLSKKGAIPALSLRKPIRPVFLFSARHSDHITYINLLPAVGYNQYDKMMIGLVAHDYNLPSNNFRFVMAPLYAIGSRKVDGLGMASYSWYPDTGFQKIEAGISGAAFSLNEGVDSTGNKIYGRFQKLAPFLRLIYRNKPARSTMEKWLEWKTFFIGERGFDYNINSADSLYYPAAGKIQTRYLNQFTFNVSDYRVLYPYTIELQLQQGAGFYRASAEAHYFFNYSTAGGLQARVFAAKFGYLGNKTSSKEFETTIYQPKLTAVRGNEDYTYSNYFAGRNEQNGLASQQVMMRDGGLKLRTDLFQGLQGRSDNWISSVNLNTTLPEKLFPFKLPIKIFLDIGTYAEAWQKNPPTSRFLYVGGLQLSLFKDLFNIYAPILYSKEFRENLKTVPEENKFFHRISFSVDVHRFNLRRISGNKFPF